MEQPHQLGIIQTHPFSARQGWAEFLLFTGARLHPAAEPPGPQNLLL